MLQCAALVMRNVKRNRLSRCVSNGSMIAHFACNIVCR